MAPMSFCPSERLARRLSSNRTATASRMSLVGSSSSRRDALVLARCATLLVFMLLGGAVADRISRRSILVTSNIVQMCAAVALFVLYATDLLGMGAILVLALVAGLAQSQSAPTYQATLTSLVPPAEIPSAVARCSTG